jgi:sirohydrochlorin ferrochelatase
MTGDQSKIALLVLVHGSPRAVANEPMFHVVEEVRRRNVYPIVEVGFMECNEPDIPTAIESCIAQGAEEIVAVPYFLHTGNHVADDLPTFLEEAQARHPAVAFRMSDFLGRSPRLTEILADRARTTGSPND